MSTTKTCRFIKDSLARVAAFTRTFGQQMNKTLETKEQSLANDISHFVCYCGMDMGYDYWIHDWSGLAKPKCDMTSVIV